MSGPGRSPREALPDVIAVRRRREALRRYRLMGLIALAVVVVDQVVKVIVRGRSCDVRGQFRHARLDGWRIAIDLNQLPGPR